MQKDFEPNVQNFKNALKDAKYWEKLQTLPLGGRQGIRFSIVIKKLQTFGEFSTNCSINYIFVLNQFTFLYINY